MPIPKLLKTGVYNESTNRCLVVERRGVVAMESGQLAGKVAHFLNSLAVNM